MPKRVLFSVVLAAVLVLATELLLQLAAAVSLRAELALGSPWDPRITAGTIPDERLIYRPNPLNPDHDRQGFRNRSVPDRAEIVALGDSQTYGTGVASHEKWSDQLASLQDRRVYNMACGGYGPVHSLLLWDEALSLEPDVIIEAIYAGNDLYDSFNLVYNHGQLPELRSQDRETAEKVVAAEAAEPIATVVSRMFRRGALAPAAPAPPPPPGGAMAWVSTRVKIYGLLRRAKYTLSQRTGPTDLSTQWSRALATAEASPEFCQVLDVPNVQTVLTPAYRLSALNSNDPRIAEGRRIALASLSAMQESADLARVEFLVVLIPTKELVLREYTSHLDDASLTDLFAAEAAWWQEVREHLAAGGIKFLDLLPALRAQVREGPSPYQVTLDGHPNGVGHAAIARAIHDEVSALGW